MNKKQIERIVKLIDSTNKKVGFYVPSKIKVLGHYNVVIGAHMMTDDQCEFIFGGNGWINSENCKPEDFYIMTPFFDS